MNPFSSKFDDFWRKAKSSGLDVSKINNINRDKFKNMGLDDNELTGLILFNNKGKCAQCHPLSYEDDTPPLFTDFTYDNLGVPRNPDNPFYKMGTEFNPDGEQWVDKGLGGFLEITQEYSKYADTNYGKHKVPTLRNVDLRPEPGFIKAFIHNGFFKSLKDLVHFYNTRDVDSADWPPPEIDRNVNKDEMGDLGLTEDEEDAIVTFMKTLSDR